MEHDEIIDTYWSDDNKRSAFVIVNKVLYPNMYKLVMKEHNDDEAQMFKFFKTIDSAQDEAEDFVLREN